VNDLLSPGLIEGFGLYLVRTSALVLAAPLLGDGAVFQGYKIGLVGVLSVMLFAAAGAPAIGDVETFDYALLAAREVVIGLSLAFVLHTVMLAVRVAGELIGHEMAFNMSSVVDPSTGISTPLVTHMYETLFLLTLLAADGHHWAIRALAESYERAPIGHLGSVEGLPSFALNLFSQLFAAGLTFAAPILVLLMLVTLLVGLLTRAVPQINVLEFGFNLRVAAGLGGMLLFAPFLAPAMDVLLGHLMDGLEAGLNTLEV
tara:strand:+ start:14304 stop:15080 length:777 start_codon:yes stop_codon:yes gene_type:complete